MRSITINEELLICIKSHVEIGNNLTFTPQLSGMDFTVYFDKPIDDKLMNTRLYSWVMDEVFNISEIIDSGKFDGEFHFEIDPTTNSLCLIADLSWFEEGSYDPYHSEILKYSVESE